MTNTCLIDRIWLGLYRSRLFRALAFPLTATVVVGGQFGSEGKGKVAQYFAREQCASIAIRVGGSNSGHTALRKDNKLEVFRQLPTASVLPGVKSVIAAGSYIDPDVLIQEVHTLDINPKSVIIDDLAVVIEQRHKDREREKLLREKIGSTLSGTGAAVIERISRTSDLKLAKDDPRLQNFTRTDTCAFLRKSLDRDERIVLEGTQGFGLSVLHSEHYPYVTSRDTTASAFLSEAGLSPLDADEVVLVLRAFPIRVAGNSGKLPNETTWETITRESGSPEPLKEQTSVTGKVRRVARFDPEVVVQALNANAPTSIVLNHLDYVDYRCRNEGMPTSTAAKFLINIELKLGVNIDYVGFDRENIALKEHRDKLGTAA